MIRMLGSLLFGLLFMLNTATADTLLNWSFGGRGTNPPATQAANNVGTNIGSSTLSLGSGLSIASNTNAFSALGMPASGSTLETAIAGNDYFTFFLQADSGFGADLTDLNYTFRRVNASSAQRFQWQYSLDGFATDGVNMGSEIVITDTVTTPYSIGLSSFGDLQSVTSVTFRLYGYDRANVSDTASGFVGNNALTVLGTTHMVPEPFMAVPLALGALLVSMRRRRRA